MDMRCLVLFAGMLVPAALVTAQVQVQTVEEIVAKVNGDIITNTEIQKLRAQAEQEMRRQGLTGAALTEAVDLVASNMLRDRIDELLLTQRALPGSLGPLQTSLDWETEIRLALAGTAN